jgi:hypothetical protein
MQSTSTRLPFIQSQYLGREVLLDELNDLTDQELRLLSTEMDGLQADASGTVSRLMTEGRDYGIMEKLVRVAGRFIYAIDREQTARQREQSFLEITNQLGAVTQERDALRRQLDHLLEVGA